MPNFKCLFSVLTAGVFIAITLWLSASHGDLEGPELENTADRVRVQALIESAANLREAGQYAQAAPILSEALALAEQIPGPNEMILAATLNQIGILDKYSGHFDDGEQAYQRALAIVEAAGKDNASDSVELLMADIYHNLGGLDHARERYAHGQAFARRSVEIRERLLGPNDPATLADIAALAALLEGQGKYKEAEQLYIHVLSAFARTNGPESYDVAVNLNNLAALYFAGGKFNEAESRYLQALAIKEKLLGKDHPDVGFTLNNLAVLYKTQGKLKDAGLLYRRALDIFEKALSPDHPKLIECRENYAQLLKRISVQRQISPKIGVQRTS